MFIAAAVPQHEIRGGNLVYSYLRTRIKVKVLFLLWAKEKRDKK
jgi:hypothetical protein